MNLEMLGLLSALIRNGLVMAQHFHRACRENRKTALTPRSLLRALFLRITHVLGLGGLDSSSSSEGATVHSLGALAPGPGDTSNEAFSSPGGATGASPGRALLSPPWGSERGSAGVASRSWGSRL